MSSRRLLATAACAAALALPLGACGGDHGTRTVERTKVQVVEGAAKSGFDPAAIYDRLSPGVVTITSIFGGGGASNLLGGGGGAGQGSGFVLDGDGYVATNAHAIL